MCKLIQHFLDLSEPPTWIDLAQAFVGALLALVGPAIFIFWAVALGADQ